MSEKKELLQFLLDQKNSLPSFLSDLKPKIKDILVMYQILISGLLTLTLRKNQGENYGLPQDSEKDPLEREIAIPYAGSDKPLEYSNFESVLMTLSYTTFCHLSKPVSDYIFRKFIEFFLKSLDTERIHNLNRATQVNQVENEFLNIIKDPKNTVE